MAAFSGRRGGTQAPPVKSNKEIERERRRQLVKMNRSGHAATVLTGGGGVSSPILSTSASIMGGTV